MTDYAPPCFGGECPSSYPSSEPTQNLCRNMSACIIGAGGAGLLETTICPMAAIPLIGPEQEDPEMAEIRTKLGIVGYFDNESLLD
jgi:hypothetical protein